MIRRQLFTFGLAAALSAVCTVPALAQASYPDKPIRLVVPYPPGGATDRVARLVSEKMAERFGQQVVVDNRPGASGVIGLDAVAKAPPDGYTLGLAINTHAINGNIMAKLPYDTAADFTPVATLATVEFLLAVHPGLDAKDLPSLLALGKSRAGGLNYGTVGSAGIGRIAGELFSAEAGVPMTHIPFRGSAPLVTSLLGGEVDLVIDTVNVYLPHIAAGKVRPIAVTGTTRLDALPNVPTFAQSGLPQFDVRMWFGILAPAGVPPAIVEKLAAEYARILAMPEVKQQMAAQELRPFVSSPAQFDAFLKAETEKYAKVIKAANIKAD